MLLLAGYATAVRPEMNRELRAYWEDARAGDVRAADEHRAAFDTRHPVAELILQSNLLILLVAAAASAVASVPGRQLEEPRLARAK